VMLVGAESATRPLLRAVSASPDRFADR